MSELNQQTISLPPDLDAASTRTLGEWESTGKVSRLWKRDSTVWTGGDEHNWLGWLTIVGEQLADTSHLAELAADIREAGFSHAMLLGMGGSSLCPEVLKMTFGAIGGFPEMHVLDSTDPAQVLTFENKVDLANTIFIVASKSGSTLEPTIFKEYFFNRVRETVGREKAGRHFVAITDPGSKLEAEARRDNFRRILYGVPEIGGRFSALSNFGMGAAAAMGIDSVRFLESANRMVEACGAETTATGNPGVALGAALGVLANAGRNKLTLVCSPGVADLGAWLEQLIAESTGKHGKAIIPVDRENLAAPGAYGDDRAFAYIRLDTAPDAQQDSAVDELQRAGQPVIRISIADIYNLGQEFFRWEIATAVAGAVIGINPFDQPDVQFSKSETKKLTDAYEETGGFPPECPVFEADGVKLYTDLYNAGALDALTGSEKTLTGYLRAHFNRVSVRDYFALLAYIEMNEETEGALQEIRTALRDKKHAATCLGFGPRFLHSTGQAYKAGPNVGVFLQVTCDDASFVGVPGRKYSFGAVKAAQARGDFQVLSDRARRALRVHLAEDVAAGLATLKAAALEALK